MGSDSRTRLVGDSGTVDDGFPEGFADFSPRWSRNGRGSISTCCMGLFVALRNGARAVSGVLDALAHATPHPVLPGRQPSGWRVASSEDRGGGRCDRLFRRTGRDHPALGQDRTSPRRFAAHRSLRVPYAPYHDVQTVVDGRGRASRSPNSYANGGETRACEGAPRIRPRGNPWPESIAPDLNGIEVGIARTYPAVGGQKRDPRM